VLVVLIERRNREERGRLAQLRELATNRSVRELDRQSGINYSNGSRVTVVIAEVGPLAETSR
jgi:hypothetical protein